MYSVAPSAGAAWRLLLERAIEMAGVAMRVIDHPPPSGLPELWARPDLGCAFMCGWPFARELLSRPIVAAPVPAAPWSEGRPVYRAEFVVAANSPFRSINEVVGMRFAYNARHSHSGWNLPLAHLAAIGAPPFSALVGPFVTHQRAIAAVAAGEADVACVDSYVLDLLRLHDAPLAGRVRVVGCTAESPIPLLVGADPRHGDPLGSEARTKLRAALLELDGDATGQALLSRLALRGFVDIDAGDYAATLATERMALRFATVAESVAPRARAPDVFLSVQTAPADPVVW
jgi:ABC-type phosphate/phosphonate transport system substrate-binding protein